MADCGTGGLPEPTPRAPHGDQDGRVAEADDEVVATNDDTKQDSSSDGGEDGAGTWHHPTV